MSQITRENEFSFVSLSLFPPSPICRGPGMPDNWRLIQVDWLGISASLLPSSKRLACLALHFSPSPGQHPSLSFPSSVLPSWRGGTCCYAKRAQASPGGGGEGEEGKIAGFFGACERALFFTYESQTRSEVAESAKSAAGPLVSSFSPSFCDGEYGIQSCAANYRVSDCLGCSRGL